MSHGKLPTLAEADLGGGQRALIVPSEPPQLLIQVSPAGFGSGGYHPVPLHVLDWVQAIGQCMAELGQSDGPGATPHPRPWLDRALWLANTGLSVTFLLFLLVWTVSGWWWLGFVVQDSLCGLMATWFAVLASSVVGVALLDRAQLALLARVRGESMGFARARMHYGVPIASVALEAAGTEESHTALCCADGTRRALVLLYGDRPVLAFRDVPSRFVADWLDLVRQFEALRSADLAPEGPSQFH